MSKGHKMWMAAIALVLVANVAAAARQASNDGIDVAVGGPDASALMMFYGVPLATSPVGAAEDKAIWMAKVQGLIAGAPAWLQQNVLASRTRSEFAANLALLQQMQRGTLEDGATAVKSLATSGKLKPKGLDPNLGISGPSDLVYTALEPCRIMDTRSATGGSPVLTNPLVGNTLYNIPGYITAGSNWGIYGGNATGDCGLNSTAGTNISAIAIVITILNPNFDAYLGVGDVNNLTTTLSTVALNYTRGQGLAALYIVPQLSNTIRFAMPTGLTANIIFDVVGYFANSMATVLECNTAQTQGAGTANVSNNSQFAFGSPAPCTAGFTKVAVSCVYAGTSPAGLALTQVGPGQVIGFPTCIWRNQTGLTLDASSFYTFTNCCRLPGR